MLIGLVATKGSGKDCLGDYLVEHFKFKKTHFADPLKEGLRHIFDLNNDQLYGKDKETFDQGGIKLQENYFKYLELIL